MSIAYTLIPGGSTYVTLCFKVLDKSTAQSASTTVDYKLIHGVYFRNGLKLDMKEGVKCTMLFYYNQTTVPVR